MARGASGQFRLHQTIFLSSWILANLFGGYLVGWFGGNEHFVYLFLTGVILGVLQWLVLSRKGWRFLLWPLVSALGWIVGLYVSLFLYGHLSDLMENLWNQFGMWQAFSVLFMALAQTLVLRVRGHFIGVWLLASLLGGVAQHMVGSVVARSTILGTLPGIVHGVGWAAYGVITGVAWLWFWRNSAATRELS